jgi:aminopeptidase N
MASLIGSLRLVMDDEDLRDAMKPYIRRLVALQLKRLGWKHKAGETHFDTLMRPIVLGLAASADEPSVVKRCHELFATIEHSESPPVARGLDIDPDLRGVVFGTVARHGDEKTFRKLVHLHNTATLSEERTTLCAAITGFTQPALIKQALAMITGEEVRLQDTAYWIAYSFLNRHAKKLTWQWLVDNWGWLEKNLGTDLSFYRTPIYAGRSFSDRAFLKPFRDFFHSVTSPALERSIKQGTEMIEWQADWKERDLKAIKAFFKS